MENKLHETIAKMVDLVVDDPSCSVDFLFLNLEDDKISADCITKNGEKLSISAQN